MTRADSNRTDFARRLKEAREAAGLSQPQLAKKVGMAQSTLAGLEMRGETSGKTAQLAAVLGVRAEWLADGTGPMKAAVSLTPEVMAIATEIDTFDPRTRARVLRLCREVLNLAREQPPLPPGFGEPDDAEEPDKNIRAA